MEEERTGEATGWFSDWDCCCCDGSWFCIWLALAALIEARRSALVLGRITVVGVDEDAMGEPGGRTGGLGLCLIRIVAGRMGVPTGGFGDSIFVAATDVVAVVVVLAIAGGVAVAFGEAIDTDVDLGKPRLSPGGLTLIFFLSFSSCPFPFSSLSLLFLFVAPGKGATDAAADLPESALS